MAGNRKKLEAAFALHRAHDVVGAEAAYREVLRKSPRDPDALHLLGVLLHQQGRHDEALAPLARAAKAQGAGAAVLNNLGEVQRALGAIDDAAASYRRALEKDPRMVSAMSNLGLVLQMQGRAEESAGLLQRAVRLRPDYAPAHYNLGNVLHEQGRPDEAMAAYRRALQLSPANASIHVNLGLVLDDLDRPVEAETSFRSALRHDPRNAEALVNLASFLRDRGRLDEALSACRQCLAYWPERSEAVAEEAAVLDLLGRPREAAERLAPLVASGKATSSAIAAFAAASRQLDRRADAITSIEAAIETRPMAAEERSVVLFELGRLLDEEDRFDEAFQRIEEANRLHPQSFDVERHRDETQRLKTVFGGAHVIAGARSTLPVFIVGMPRSGTSLVEQILAAHPEVHGAGELEDINRIIDGLPALAGTGATYPDCVTDLDRTTVDALASGHLASLQARAPDKSRIVDKLPGNFRNLGLIAMLFPGAQVIHCRRDPLDTCLSCYFQRFSGSHPYAYDLGNLGHYYRDYCDLMAHWHTTLDLAILDVGYEQLVAEQEDVSREMIAFLGLDWDPRVLDYHRSGRVVLTASYDQVRRPIYDRSVGRHNRYSAYLRPLIEALGA
ncbi:MAG: hypothetical protein CMM50_03340 [Rhodospirillaceae bacterium]|nr:hypothetical protein [Rhodospirillaceae bacterium]